MPLPYQISSPMNTNVQGVESIEDIYMSSRKRPENKFILWREEKYPPQNIMQSI